MASANLRPVPLPGPPALDEELEQFHPSSFGWAMVCCDWNRELAEDVLQSAYLKAIEGRARFNGDSSVRTWFFGVVRNTASEARRSSLSRRLGIERWMRVRPDAPPVATPEELSHDTEVQRRLQALLRRLSPRQRELLHLVFYQELTIEEAAGVLHLTVGTARTHYERGKARLRKLLGEAGEGS